VSLKSARYWQGFPAVELTGPEKAVLLLLSLDEEAAAPLIAELDPDDIRKLREVASIMREVPASALEHVYSEFINRSKGAVAVPRGGVRYLKRVTTKALGETKAREIFFDGPQTAMQQLAAAEPAALAAVMENEHPQLIAAVLSQLPNERASAVIEAFNDELRALVVQRLARMTEVPAGLLEEAAAALRAELPTQTSEALISIDGINKSAAMVRHMSRPAADGLLGDIARSDGELVNEIRGNMYTFEDLRVLDAKAVRSVLDNVPSETLTIALKTASEELKAHIFKSMSKRAADRIREDLELMGGVKLSDVENAQKEIVEQCLVLAAEGVISFEESGSGTV